MKDTPFLLLEDRLQNLTERRNLIEKKLELRDATYSEFKIVRGESLDRAYFALQRQNEEKRIKNEKFLDTVNKAANGASFHINENLHTNSKAYKLKESYRNYLLSVETLLPAWKHQQSEIQLNELRQIQYEKEIAHKRRERAYKNNEENQLIHEAIEKERRELVLALALEQKDKLKSLAHSTLLKEEGKAVDSAIFSEIESVGKQIQKLVTEKTIEDKSSVALAVRQFFPPNELVDDVNAMLSNHHQTYQYQHHHQQPQPVTMRTADSQCTQLQVSSHYAMPQPYPMPDAAMFMQSQPQSQSQLQPRNDIITRQHMGTTSNNNSNSVINNNINMQHERPIPATTSSYTTSTAQYHPNDEHTNTNSNAINTATSGSHTLPTTTITSSTKNTSRIQSDGLHHHLAQFSSSSSSHVVGANTTNSSTATVVPSVSVSVSDASLPLSLPPLAMVSSPMLPTGPSKSSSSSSFNDNSNNNKNVPISKTMTQQNHNQNHNHKGNDNDKVDGDGGQIKVLKEIENGNGKGDQSNINTNINTNTSTSSQSPTTISSTTTAAAAAAATTTMAGLTMTAKNKSKYQDDEFLSDDDNDDNGNNNQSKEMTKNTTKPTITTTTDSTMSNAPSNNTPLQVNTTTGPIFDHLKLPQCRIILNTLFELIENLPVASSGNKVLISYSNANKNIPSRNILEKIGTVCIEGNSDGLDEFSNDVIAGTILMLLKERGIDALPQEALQGTVTLDKVQLYHKKAGGGRLEFWNCITQHLTNLIESKNNKLSEMAKSAYLNEIAKIFTEALIHHADPSDRSRVERKAVNLLKSVMLPKETVATSPRPVTPSPSTRLPSSRSTLDPFATPEGSPDGRAHQPNSARGAGPNTAFKPIPMNPALMDLEPSNSFILDRPTSSGGSGNSSKKLNMNSISNGSKKLDISSSTFGLKGTSKLSELEELEIDDDLLNSPPPTVRDSRVGDKPLFVARTRSGGVGGVNNSMSSSLSASASASGGNRRGEQPPRRSSNNDNDDDDDDEFGY
eukprot:gene7635-15625_t